MAKVAINNKKEDIHIGLIEEFGQIQFEIFPKIKNAVELFKSQNIKNILDLGCGFGWNTIFLSKEGFDIWAGEISSEYINVLKSKANEMNLKNINCEEFDMKNISRKNDGVYKLLLNKRRLD